MNRFPIALLVFLGLFLAGGVQAQPSTPFVPPERPARYWIVVEKTSESKAFHSAIRQTLFDLIYHGAGGEMQDGSVFEIWIYGSDTKIRGFTPEMLRPDNRLQAAMKASRYFDAAASSGPGDMTALAEHVGKMASVVFETTVFFVSAPTTRFDGTSIDDEVNTVLDVHRERMIEEAAPYVTTLRVQDGGLAGFSVSESALSMTVPPMPPSRVAPEERARLIAEARERIDAEETARLKAIAEAERKRMEAVEAEKRRRAELRRQVPDEEREGAIILRGSHLAKTEPQLDSPAASPVTSPPQPMAVEVIPSVETNANELDSNVADKASADPSPVASDKDAGAGSVVESVDSVAATTAEGVEPSPEAPAAAAPATQGRVNWLTATGLVVAGVLFLAVAGLMVWVAVRRTREGQRRVSAISQSMRGGTISR